jgi:catechol 1,2-dioxygenase
MQRRNFIRNSALCAVAVSASGFIRFDGNGYIGDCETTTDILGPFYRPDSPVRNDLVIKGERGIVTQLSGVINHKDCVTPYKNASIELWHCDAAGVYDNSSADYRYRGTTHSDDKGYYSFRTVLPVPYGIGGGQSRPAHFHLMIRAAGYQPLVTQLYFTGDPYLAKDPSSASPAARRRILAVQTLADGTKKITYNVGMSDTLAVEPTALEKLAGIYIHEKDKNMITALFTKNNELWMKNEVYGENLIYLGDNNFELPTSPPSKAHFEILSSGAVRSTVTRKNEKGEEITAVFIKEK